MKIVAGHESKHKAAMSKISGYCEVALRDNSAVNFDMLLEAPPTTGLLVSMSAVVQISFSATVV